MIAAVGTGSGIEITNNAISNTSTGIVVPDGASANAIFLDRVPGVIVSGNQISSYSFADSLKAVGTGIVLTGEPGQTVSASGVSGNPISGVGEKSYDLRYVSGFQLVGVTIDEPLKVRDSDAVLIQDCVFDSIGPSSLGPVLTLSGCDGATVEESVFTNNDGRSILANGASNLVIRNNLFDGNQGLACLTVSGAAATDVEILDNEFVDNFPLDLSSVPTAEKLLAVILVADAGAGVVIDGNTIWNRSVPSGTGSLANGQRASAISIGSTDGASVTDNVITSYRFSGFVDLTADFDPSFLITPAEGGQVGGGISLSAESGQSFNGGVVSGNLVSGCGSIGIAVGRGSNLSIASNSVSWCGAHGIQLSSDIEKLGGVPVVPRSTPMTGSVIENNVTYENGWLHGGNSGIGLFYAGTDDGSPANIIRGNYSFRNRQGTHWRQPKRVALD